MHVYVWLSPLAGHLKLSQCCYSAIPQYKIKSSKEKKSDRKRDEECFILTQIFCVLLAKKII